MRLADGGGGELEEKRRGANGEEMEEEIYTRGIFFFFFDRTRIRSIRMIRINLIVNDLLLCYVLEIFRRVEFFMSNIFETDCDENIKYLII